MSDVSGVCACYFRGFSEISSKETPCCIRAVAFCKILSYFTLVLPLIFAFALGIETLKDRCSKMTQERPLSMVSETSAKIAEWANSFSTFLEARNFEEAVGDKSEFIQLVHQAALAYSSRSNLDEVLASSGDPITVGEIFNGLKQSQLFLELAGRRSQHNATTQEIATQLLALKALIPDL